jgi:hypothetical protein
MFILQGAVICDAARDYGGKVSILGGFVSILWPTQLGIPAPIWFAGRVAFSHDELDRPHSLQIIIKNDQDAELARVTGEMPIQDSTQLPTQELMGGTNLVLPLPFPMLSYEMHWIELWVDNVSLVRLPLLLKQPPVEGA